MFCSMNPSDQVCARLGASTHARPTPPGLAPTGFPSVSSCIPRRGLGPAMRKMVPSPATAASDAPAAVRPRDRRLRWRELLASSWRRASSDEVLARERIVSQYGYIADDKAKCCRVAFWTQRSASLEQPISHIATHPREPAPNGNGNGSCLPFTSVPRRRVPSSGRVVGQTEIGEGSVIARQKRRDGGFIFKIDPHPSDPAGFNATTLPRYLHRPAPTAYPSLRERMK